MLTLLTFINTDTNKSQLNYLSGFKGAKISKLTIPNSITTIGNNAFYGNKNLTDLTFEEGSKLTIIGMYAFDDCNLTYTDSKNPLVIPSSVTSIGGYAFYSNSSGTDESPQNRNLKFIRFEGTLRDGNTTIWYDSNTTLNPPIEE